MTKRAKEFNILLDDVAITHLSFGAEVCITRARPTRFRCYNIDNNNPDRQLTGVLQLQFTKAVEAKQVAQQDAERARFVVMRADQVCI